MILKCLDIQGFKSFPDKTHIDFNNGMTVVVGPNGSGKSNISDAIRWVLGEQSTKALRGDKMTDVIFSGTESRKPMGSAEVSLTFNNEDGSLKTDYKEVTVTRKFYRSGDSDFYINRKSVRLRDIHELFMDTGLGRDGYSMIGQGKIDEILSVKSEDRREVFDEAAGISKYRYRREEAQKRLADAMDNLQRINTMLEDMEMRIEPLEKEAERERKYNAINDELRIADVSLILYDLAGVKPRLEQAQQSAEAIHRDIDENTCQLEERQKASDSIMNEMLSAQLEYEKLRAELENSSENINAVSGELAVKKASLEHFEQDIQRILREKEEFDKNRSEAEEKIKSSDAAAETSVLRQKEERLALEEQEKLRNSITLQREKLSLETEELNKKLNAENEKIAALQSGISAAKASCEELDRQLKLMDGDEETRRKALEEAKTKCTGLEEELAGLNKRLPGYTNIENGFKLKLSSREGKVQQLSKKVQQLTIDCAELQNRIKLLSELEKDYEGFNQAVRFVMRQSGTGNLKGILGPVSSLMKADDKYVAAAETALGAAMQNIVVDNEQSARAAMGMLKSRDAGRATFLPLTTIRPNRLNERGLDGTPGFLGILSDLVTYDKKYENVFLNLLGRTAVTENIDDAIDIAKAFGHRFRIVTLDGQVMNAGGSMTGGSLNRSTGVLSRANELERLRLSLPRMEEELAKVREEADNAEREYKSLSYQLEVAVDERRQAENEKFHMERELLTQKTLYDNLQFELESRDERRTDILKRIAASQDEENRLKDECESVKTASDGIKTEIEAKKQKDSEYNDKINAVTEAIAGIREKLSALAGEERMHRSESVNLRVAVNASAMRVQQSDSEIARIHEQRAETEQLIKELEEKQSQMRSAAENGRQIMEAAAAKRSNLDMKRMENDREVQRLNGRTVELERAALRADSQLAEAQGEEANLTGRLWDTYGLTRLTAADIAQSVEERRPVERRIESLRRSIRELGTIYPGAIREYETLCERKEFMSAQKNDAEESKRGIEDIIDDITKRMAELFAEQFVLINNNFTKTFADIFGGGSAELQLTDPSNVLESGIEIKVQMPGKSAKILSLLSGGERALTAIALYFAILKVRPTPFCVLDEIESALDDINVKRFADYLGTLKGETQFIVISHRRGTMEAADMLYGVTMVQRGISKLLALNMSEAEKNFIKE